MFTGPKEVIVKRVPRSGYFGIGAYPRSTERIGAAISKSGFVTGLTKEEEAYYEEKLGLKAGDLNKHSKWWSDVFNVLYSPTLNKTKPTTLVLDGFINQIQYKVLLASSKIANTEIERNKPDVDFYIVDEEAKAKLENEAFDYEMEAMELLIKLSPEDKRASLRLFGKKGVDDFSESVVKAELRKEIKKDPKLFVETLRDKRLKTKLLLEELIEYKVLSRKGNYYINGDDTIAASTDEAVEYLEDMKNQSVVLALGTRLKKLKKG